MHKALIFDTFEYVKRLKDVGFTDQQAVVQAETLKELLEEQLATKRDLKEMVTNLTIRLGFMITSAIAIVATLVKLL
jgi:hypothetical protein